MGEVTAGLIMFDAFLFVRVVARDDGAGWFTVAEVDGLVRYVSRDEEKVARFVDDLALQIGAVAGEDAAREEVDGCFIAAV